MKLLIFDFDGTIADTKAVYYKAIEENLKNWGFSQARTEQAINLGLSLRKTLGNLGLNFLSRWMLKRKIMVGVEKYSLEIKKCKDVDAIKKINCKKILVTNSLKEFAYPILNHLKLRKTFSEIYGADDFSDKTEFISEYIIKNKIEKKECYYIGDRVADVKLARGAGCVSVIVTGKCAWNSRKELIRAKPDFILDDIKDIKKIL